MATFKEIATALCKRFCIKGACDPMYIQNFLASETNAGNGAGIFYQQTIPEESDFHALASSLHLIYGSNISEDEIGEVEEILRTGTVDTARLVKGLTRYILNCRIESKKQNCDEWRRDYLVGCINTARKTIMACA